MQAGKGDLVTCSGAMQTRDFRESHAREKKKTRLCRGGPRVEEGPAARSWVRWPVQACLGHLWPTGPVVAGLVRWVGLVFMGLVAVGPYKWAQNR